MSYLVSYIEQPSENLDQMVEVIFNQESSRLGHKCTAKRFVFLKTESPCPNWPQIQGKSPALPS